MKKIILLMLITLLSLSCMFSSMLPEQVVTNFIEGLENQDIDLLMSAYHSDADFRFVAPDGSEDSYTGADEIRAAQLGGFEDQTLTPEIRIMDWEESTDKSKVTYYLVADFTEFELLNTLELTSEFYSWGILHQKVEINQ